MWKERGQVLKVFKISVVTYLDPEGRKCKKCEAIRVDSLGQEALRSGYQKVPSKSKN